MIVNVFQVICAMVKTWILCPFRGMLIHVQAFKINIDKLISSYIYSTNLYHKTYS